MWTLLAIAACGGDRSHVGENVAVASPGPATASSTPADAGAAASSDAGDARAIPPCRDVTDDRESAPHDTLTLTRATFSELEGWADDKLSEAVPAFLRSCEQLAKLRDGDPVGHDGHGGRARQWRRACRAAARVTKGDDAAARKMFEAEFVPWLAAGEKGPDGKMTAYIVQELHASRTKHGKYQTPVYARPKDLVEIELSSFIRDGHGRRIWGKVGAGGKLEPYVTRKQIRLGALKNRGLELVYVDEPIDLLFAHIEGSAKALLDDGTVMWLDFAGKNGRHGRGLGSILKSKNAFHKPYNGTMQGIHHWLEDHRGQWNSIVDQISSFVFFQKGSGDGPLGTQLAALTAKRSLAVDRAFIALSTPIWVDTKAPVYKQKRMAPWRRLMIAQDTGGNIRGAVRGDLYFGDDAEAADRGGRMGGKGRFWLLLPKGVSQ